MELIDSHCHFDFPAFDEDRDRIRQRAREAGVVELVVPGVSAATWDRLEALVAADAGLHHALGLHPLFLAEHDPDRDVAALETRLKAPGLRAPVAVGEIGLDHRAPEGEHTEQEALLDAQLDLAAAHDRPVIIHAVRAHHRLTGRLRRWPGPGGVIHAFNGSPEDARRYTDSGFLLGIGGLVTRPRNRRLRELVACWPLSDLLLETDAPDMAPEGWAAERNSPEAIPGILEEVAALRKECPESIAAATTANARRLFRLQG